MDDQTMTPAEAERLGNRWTTPACAAFVLAVMFAVLGLATLEWLAVAVCLVCVREATAHFAWRRGYLAAKQEARSARLAGGRRG